MAGLVVASAVLGWALWACAPLSRRPGVRAWGGVVGREGRGWLYRDGDRLTFVRSWRRYSLPLRPDPGQALRRYLRPDSRSVPRVDAYVLRDDSRAVHDVGATVGPREVERLAGPDRAGERVTFPKLVPRWGIVPAFALAVCVVWLAVWCAAAPVMAVVVARNGPGGGAGCVVTWRPPGGSPVPTDVSADGRADGRAAGRADGQAELGCHGSTVVVGTLVPIRALAAPLGGRAMDGRSDVGAWVALLAGVSTLAWLGWLAVRASVSMRGRLVELYPVPDGGSGLRGLTPTAALRRAEGMTSYELAVAVQLTEGHADLEDNDLVRTRLRVLVTHQGTASLVLMAISPAIVAGLVLFDFPWWAVLGLCAGVVVLVAQKGRRPIQVLRAMSRAPDASRTTSWPEAAAWRRSDGTVAACLFAHGRLAWLIPVDRVFAPGTALLVHGNPAVPGPVWLTANGVGLLAGVPERGSGWREEQLRANLVAAAFGRPLPARYWT